MQDKELYQHILGLTSPWTVSGVKLDIPAEEIQVRVEHPPGTKFCCPECQKELACYDHAEERIVHCFSLWYFFKMILDSAFCLRQIGKRTDALARFTDSQAC